MSFLDIALLVAIALAILGGYRLGLITRVVSWIGLAAGLALAVWLLPRFLDQLDSTNSGLLLVLSIGLLLVGATLGQAIGFVVGGRLTPRRRDGAFGAIDRVLGGMAGLVGVVIILWLVIPIFIASPGWLASQTSNSWIARTVENSLPPAPDAMQALRSVVGQDSFPDVFDALRPTPNLGAPPESTGLSLDVAARVARSVVKVEGPACNKLQDGSGFVIGDGLIVTNAHVVAGERSTNILRDDGRRFDGTVIAFDPARDLAVVRVSGFDRPPLPLSNAKSEGTSGGVFGHPGGEPLRIAPFKVARLINATGRDIYGSSKTERKVLEISATLRPGDSGSALVNQQGEVVGIAFAIARDIPNVAYALTPSELQATLATTGTKTVSTGSCLN
ncbi:MAG: MarP family serine protease [Actinobacteria bacterium]|nr:MarP family serine protease [Actinomycetota bacterium]